jgi:hypothetical protein
MKSNGFKERIYPGMCMIKKAVVAPYLFLALLQLFPSTVFAADPVNFYVSTNGKKGAIGSKAFPIVSLRDAVSAAGKLKGVDVIINMASGTYYLDQPLRISATDINLASLKIQGAVDGKTIISAGRKLQLNWGKANGSLMKAKIPSDIEFERLYVDGKLEILARYPNFSADERFYNGTAADAVSDERVAGWKNPVGGYLHGLHAGEWGSFDYQIKARKANGELVMEGGYQNNRPNELHKERRFIENIFEELDAPNEWFFDRKSSTLYYYPEPGLDLNNVRIEVSRFKNSFELIGTAEKPLKNVTLSNITFLHNERSFMETKEPLLRSDWTVYRGGAVLLDGTERVQIIQCTFQGLGGNAVFFSNYNLNGLVKNCHIYEIGASAVCFVGSAKAVRSPLFNYDEHMPVEQIDMKPGPASRDYPQSCRVDNNLFHHLGEIEKQATGVQIAMSSDISVTRNSIYHVPRAGINIGDGCWGGHEIAFNDVFETVLETGDHGAFNSWGRDRFWDPDRAYMNKITARNPELILLDAIKTNTIHDNRFRCDHGWDIDLDDGSSNYHIYNNVCLNGGLKLREGFCRTVENNIIVNNSFHPHVWFAASGDVFRHNIVMTAYAPIQMNRWGKKIDSNFFPSANAMKQSTDVGNDENSRFGDPEFMNPDRGDYHVKSGSGALKIGFKNFPEHFGVQYAPLKKMAAKPVIPVLKFLNGAANVEKVIDFLGGKIKSIQGLGDRSAYGLPDENGIVIIDAGVNSLLTHSGLASKDVIRSVQGKAVKNAEELFAAIKANVKGEVSISIMRNQQTRTLSLKLN